MRKNWDRSERVGRRTAGVRLGGLFKSPLRKHIGRLFKDMLKVLLWHRLHTCTLPTQQSISCSSVATTVTSTWFFVCRGHSLKLRIVHFLSEVGLGIVLVAQAWLNCVHEVQDRFGLPPSGQVVQSRMVVPLLESDWV